MAAEFALKRFRALRRKMRKLSRKLLLLESKKFLAGCFVFGAFAIFGLGVLYKQSMTPPIDPATYTPLLNTIAEGESKGNYNAYFSNAANTDIKFTEMSVAEVLKWQENFVSEGNPSSAVGKYQIIRPTLVGLVEQLGIEESTLYDEALQDRLAIALLERRGAADFMEKKLSPEDFAAELAKEWAALPKVVGENPEQSYYAGDGLNASRISIEEIFKTLSIIQNK
jgi:conjugal transfer mating pair stabilization protein TraG